MFAPSPRMSTPRSFGEQPARSPARVATLLSRVRDPNDQCAWREFEHRYRKLILSDCRRCGLPAPDAEDIWQTILMILVTVLPSFRYDPTRGPFRRYLRRIVRRSIIRYRNHRYQRLVFVDTEEMSRWIATHDPLHEGWEREWRTHHYRQAIRIVQQYHSPQSMATFERLVGGESAAKLAQERRTTRAAVTKLRQRIQRELRRQIQRQIQAESKAKSRP